ncbi:MAG: SDR family NAD(P)-dependent oxidoreductase [bacterium]|nr:SDR family NAD(P)-dependent oxidoreductase [bacterium]
MSHFLDLSGHVVLVTGSTKHLGRVMAELFAEHGAMVIINSRHDEDIKRTVRELHAKGYAAEGIRADVGEEKEVEAMLRIIKDRFGRLDVVVNNAAARTVGSRITEELDKADWDEKFRTNVLGAFYICQGVIPLMKAQKNGVILNISSGTAFGKPPAISSLSYAASKGALISFTKGLAKELGGEHIRVNAVVLPLLRHREELDYAPDVYRNAALSAPLKRLVDDKEVAATLLFLASGMSSAITGEVIALGGLQNITTEF